MSQSESMQRSRKAFSRRMWRRRWLNLRVVIASVIAVAVLAGVIWAVWWSDWLSVHGVEVTGTDRLTAAQVERVAGVSTGEALISVDTDAIARRVESIPAVKSVDVTRDWPNQVAITVTERTPVATVQIGSSTKALDADGIVFSTPGRLPGTLPRVVTSAGTSTDALREAATVAASLPTSISTKVDHLEVVTADKILLDLSDGRVVVWGSAEESDVKAQVLTAMLGQPGQTIDVSVPGNPTTSPTRE